MSRFSNQWKGTPKGQMESLFGVSVTYARDSNSVALTPLITEYEVDEYDSQGDLIRTIVRDYLFPVEDLILDGSATLPQRDDTITEITGGVTRIYTVLDREGEGCYRYGDMEHTFLRVHTKLTSKS